MSKATPHQALQQQCFWVTRPAHQGEALCDRLRMLGAQCLHKPTLKITSLPIEVTPPPADHALCAVFTSANAVHASQKALRNLQRPVHCLAVGPATAQALTQAGLTVAHTAPPPYGGDALLSLPLWQSLPTRTTLMLFTGTNSSAPLIDALKTMGASPVVYRCYQRCPPNQSLRDLFTPEDQKTITGIICTSRDTLTHAIDIAGTEHASWLLQTPVLVISDAMRTQAAQSGFTTIVQAENATDAAIVTRLCQMH